VRRVQWSVLHTVTGASDRVDVCMRVQLMCGVIALHSVQFTPQLSSRGGDVSTKKKEREVTSARSTRIEHKKKGRRRETRRGR